MSKIKLKAKPNAPEAVQVGNLTAENKDGYFYAETRDFADYIIAQGYGAEIQPAKPRASKPAAAKKPAAVKKDEAAKPAAEIKDGEKSTEGETK